LVGGAFALYIIKSFAFRSAPLNAPLVGGAFALDFSYLLARLIIKTLRVLQKLKLLPIKRSLERLTLVIPYQNC
ncbi:hypothetical protein, partial [Helicobacter bizzozeronii]|uniref:hypothetical protein n=1 Tax=Helicobacter bizzozeronii TaxID=56877 RepID=UPI001B33C498